MDIKELNQIVEPWVVRGLRKVLTWGIGLALSWLAARQVTVDPARSAELALAIAAALGPVVSYVLSGIVDRLLKGRLATQQAAESN